LLASAVALPMSASAAPDWSGPGVPHTVFVRLPQQPALEYPNGHAPAGTLAQWNGSFIDLIGHNVNFVMVGADPAVSNTATHVAVDVIPVIFVYGRQNGNRRFDPTVALLDGNLTVIQSLAASPIFDSGVDFPSGSVDCGQTQFVDAFQRCNFWSHVSTNTGYHTLLDYTTGGTLNPLKITVTAAQGKVMNNPFGSGVVGTYPINNFDSQAHSYITSHSAINPTVLPFFVSYDIYLTSGGCCIGGYHSASGAQSYGYTTVVDSAGAFSEDIDAASHELSEWMDDPFTNNRVECTDNSILEVGDPLEGLANYGTFPVMLNGYTWHPQSEANLPYFGAPTSTSANGWYSFHNELTHFCPGPQ
jgi:hypothetical protein